jgi:hypothetical protein
VSRNHNEVCVFQMSKFHDPDRGIAIQNNAFCRDASELID